MTQLFVYAFLLIAVMAANRSRLLTTSGMIAAFFTGLFVNLGFGLKGLFLLVLFFISSSLWSKIKNTNKQQAEEMLVKGSTRDWQQVLANGGVAAFTSALYYITADPIWIIGFCILIACSNSDTWASEIGSMSKRRPYNIRTFKKAERGTSGAVSPLGTFASIVGSFIIALTGYILFELNLSEMIFITIFGFLGNVIDTLLGAYVQAGYLCANCGLKTEKTFHCGHQTRLIKGYSFINNDFVNFFAGFLSLLIGLWIIKM
ncbi:DUF92 domain-containing protein [Niallia sp. XMNu-256]|uniref:DUF92 domain-containing protein n=1 Tax=Niallia sp. XMNu-256 TaxID=3082444 RepID=UPI0030CB7D0E